MGNRESVRTQGMVTLFFFAWFCLMPASIRAGDEDPLETARKLIQAGSYEEAARVLGIYIEKIRAIAKQKNQVAEAYYLLAKMYFEVGDDQKCDDSLRAALKNNPEISQDEPTAGFSARLDKIRAEVAPQVFEKLKKAEQRRLQPRKKFPWLLVAGTIVATVLVIVFLMKKKNYTLTVTIGAGVSGTPAAGSYTYKKGTLVPYQFELGADYKDLMVKSNGMEFAASGNLAMDRDTQLEVSATPMSFMATLNVNAKSNCFILNNSAAVEALIDRGSYTVQTSGNAYYNGTDHFKAVLVCYESLDSITHFAALTIGQSYNLDLRSIGAQARFHAFFVEEGELTDNSGEVTLLFGSQQIKVHGKNNCISAWNLSAAKISIPAGPYSVHVSGSAYNSPSTTMNEILVFYHGVDGITLQALTIGQTTRFYTYGSNFYAFFVEKDNVGDNSGVVQLEFFN
ncbi:MAG: hypothetical protein NTW95_01240 [Candidatus Aminicenantes bacterium]|nr:hypothetical protein [Candidatus Aminicenantes bacterium]